MEIKKEISLKIPDWEEIEKGDEFYRFFDIYEESSPTFGNLKINISKNTKIQGIMSLEFSRKYIGEEHIIKRTWNILSEENYNSFLEAIKEIFLKMEK